MNLISLSYAQQFPALANLSAPYLQTIIALASGFAESYCDRKFYAKRYTSDAYGRKNFPTLSLRNAPLIQLNTVTLFPDVNPQVFTPAAYDIRYATARLAFKPTVAGSFWSFPRSGAIDSPQNGQDVAVADYFSGYGYVTTLTAAIAPGANVVLPLTALLGFVPEQGPWTIESGELILDSGLQTEEEVSVTVAGNTVTASSVLYAHATASYVSGALVPQQAQGACALLASNLANAGDLTKAEEQIGRLGGYIYTNRKGNVILTDEIRSMLARYRDVGC